MKIIYMGLVFWCKSCGKRPLFYRRYFQMDDQRGLERYQGFLDAMQNQGLTVPDRNICWYTTQELDDFRQRTKVSKTVIDLMAELGLFGNLPQSNQLSLFDFS